MLTRRDFLKYSAGIVMAGGGMKLDPAQHKPKYLCRPVISGSLWWVNPAQCEQWGISGWRDELDRQQRIGFNLLWLVNAAGILDNPKFSLRDLLDLCGKRKMQVVLDTGSSEMWYAAPLDVRKELDVCGVNIEKIGERFKDHPAFYAWYVPQEIYMCWGDFAKYIDELYPALVDKCKKAADRPVTLSPFFILDRDKVFGDFRFNEPDEYRRYWSHLIRRSGFDVIMLQDSGEHFSYVTNDQRRPFFEAMQAACRESGSELWGNVESAEFECPSKEEYVRRYGRVHHSTVKDAPWRPVPVDRLKQKLQLAAEYSTKIVTWGYTEYGRPALGPKAEKWYNDYRNYVRGTYSISSTSR